MHSSLSVRRLQKTFGVSGAQFGDGAVFKYLSDYLVLGTELFKYLGARGVTRLGLFARGELQLFKKNLSKLFRGIDIELPARQHIYTLCLLRLHLLQLFKELGQSRGVELEARMLHIRKNGGKGKLYILIKLRHTRFIKLFRKDFAKIGDRRRFSAYSLAKRRY